MLRVFIRIILVCCATTALVPLGHAEVQVPYAIDLQGHPVTSLAPASAKIVVLIFAATDCPICNRYIPEITRLETEFKPQGVALWWVYPNPSDTSAVVRQHAADYRINAPTLLDRRQALVRLSHVSVTPQAAVFTASNGLHEVYRGRIDDRYFVFGQEHPEATQHELETAINAVLSGKPAPKASGNPIGCSIVPLAQKP